MADKKRVLFVTQELDPYVAVTNIAKIARKLPQFAQNEGMEIRILMPKFGTINERRHRLHEVVRLSGMNIIIDQDDFPLIIKVASLPGARMQVYFLDNEDFFKRKGVFTANGKLFADNSERMIFFCKGVMETVRKFGWPPDIIHCHGWMTSLIPAYMRTAYKNEPVFSKAKVVYSVYTKSFEGELSKDFVKKAALIQQKVTDDAMKSFKDASHDGLAIGAIAYSDAVVMANGVNGPVEKAIKKTKKPLLKLSDEADLSPFRQFYKDVLAAN
jgi:starch synthase